MKSLLTYVPLTICFCLLAGYNFMQADWSAPTATAPADNTAAPVNIGSTTQAKSGNLAANIFAATTEIRSNRYCDALGNNCFTATSTSGGGDTITIGGICFEPALAVTCNWNWSGNGNDNSVYMGAISADPSSVCSDVNRSYQYHDIVLAKCGTGRYEWSTGSWSACNAPAREYGTSNGTQTRTVQCVDTINGNAVVADSNCSASKPSTSQACSLYWGGRGAP